MAQFGDLLAELRQDRGLTQSELGKVISVTSGTISNYEHGFHLPDLEKLVLLADYFGVSTDYKCQYHFLITIFDMKLTTTFFD